MTTAQALGLRVPADLSLVAWDDSALCGLVNPSLTALSRDIAAYGADAARQLRALAAGTPVGDLQDPGPVLIPRGSTSAP